MVELTNGCICCTLRDDLLLELQALAARPDVDYILIEAIGLAEPLPLAQGYVRTGTTRVARVRYERRRTGPPPAVRRRSSRPWPRPSAPGTGAGAPPARRPRPGAEVLALLLEGPAQAGSGGEAAEAAQRVIALVY